MVRASEHSGTIDQDDWTHNTDCDRGVWLGQVTGGFWLSFQLVDATQA
jgi:hypothetical protein